MHSKDTHTEAACEKYTNTYGQTHSHELVLDTHVHMYCHTEAEIYCQAGMLPENYVPE